MAERQKRTSLQAIGAATRKVAGSPVGRAVGTGLQSAVDFARSPDTLLRAASIIPNPVQLPAAVIQSAADIARFVGEAAPEATSVVAPKATPVVPPGRLAGFAAADAGTILPRKRPGKEVATDLAAQDAAQTTADRKQFAELRRQLGTLDIGDIEAERKYLTSISSTGRLSSGSAAALDKRIQERRATALAAMQAIDTNRNNVRSGDIAETIGAAQITNYLNQVQNRNLSEKDKAFMRVIADAALPANANNKPLQERARALTSAMLAEAAQREATQGVQGKADGGEILPPEKFAGASDQAPPKLPGAINEAPLPLDSGDYIVPVEAMPFYGRKFFQDLINKAEDAG